MKSRHTNLLNKQLLQLNEIGNDITKSISHTDTDISNFVENIYEKINRLIDAPIVVIAIHNKESNLLDYHTIESGKYIKVSSRELHRMDNAIVECFRESKSMIIDNYEKSKYHKALKGEGRTPKTVAAYTLIVDDIKIGVFTVQSFKNQAYKGKEMLINNLSDKIAIAINNFLSYEKMYDSNIVISTILSILKHDLPDPINFGLQALDNLSKKKSFDKSTKGSLSLIQTAFIQLKEQLELINILDLEISKAKIPISFEIIHPKQFFNDIITRYETYYKNNGVNLSIILLNIRDFISDKNVIRFILPNLITNAFKSIQLKKTELRNLKGKIVVSIKTDLQEKILYIRVADNGVGIDNSGKSIKEFKIGSGKALKLCRQVINIYNENFLDRLTTNQLMDNLSVKNNEKEVGCTFYLHLPIKTNQ